MPGVVLAVAPNNSMVLVNDPIRQLFYLYNPAAGNALTFGGLGVAAEWTPDSKTLYIVDSASANDAAKGITGHTNSTLRLQRLYGLDDLQPGWLRAARRAWRSRFPAWAHF